jgi:hypothetical protein
MNQSILVQPALSFPLGKQPIYKCQHPKSYNLMRAPETRLNVQARFSDLTPGRRSTHAPSPPRDWVLHCIDPLRGFDSCQQIRLCPLPETVSMYPRILRMGYFLDPAMGSLVVFNTSFSATISLYPCLPCKAARTVCVIATDLKRGACINPRNTRAADVVVARDGWL